MTTPLDEIKKYMTPPPLKEDRCEITFWVVIAIGLVIRYILKKEKLGFRVTYIW